MNKLYETYDPHRTLSIGVIIILEESVL